ncbi:unnamed protein product [Clonostachys rosea f. rosea IK726]|uniref:Uncharacterized protein n=1 Tax=Clonostachys rosea f. rosea IK726 TaxID=1349383 RepID=A0ACA9TRV7_BIOOC|nr:unnamed protein product [Clonostachys rosea f. rosea IK726]
MHVLHASARLGGTFSQYLSSEIIPPIGAYYGVRMPACECVIATSIGGPGRCTSQPVLRHAS